MKKFLVALLILSAPHAFAWKSSFEVQATGGSPIPSSFDKSNAQSFVMSGITQASEICVFNETKSRIAINSINWDAASPSTVTHRIPAGGWLCTTDKVSSSLYIKGDTGAISDNGYVHGFAR